MDFVATDVDVCQVRQLAQLEGNRSCEEMNTTLASKKAMAHHRSSDCSDNTYHYEPRSHVSSFMPETTQFSQTKRMKGTDHGLLRQKMLQYLDFLCMIKAVCQTKRSSRK